MGELCRFHSVDWSKKKYWNLNKFIIYIINSQNLILYSKYLEAKYIDGYQHP